MIRVTVLAQLAAIFVAGSPLRWTHPASQQAGQAAPECISAGSCETNPAVLSKPTPGGHGHERLASTPFDSAAAADTAATARPALMAGAPIPFGSHQNRTPRISICRWLI